MWAKLYNITRVKKDDAVRTRLYLLCHLKDIAEENLIGQCTDGHSCKQRSQEQLKRLIREQGGGDHMGYILNDKLRSMCKKTS